MTVLSPVQTELAETLCVDTRREHRGDLLTMNIDHLEKTTAAARVPHSHRRGGGGGRSGVCLCVGGGGGGGKKEYKHTNRIRLGAETKQTRIHNQTRPTFKPFQTHTGETSKTLRVIRMGLTEQIVIIFELNRAVRLVCAKSRILFFQTDDDICPKGLH